jgi:hypothetical protein
MHLRLVESFPWADRMGQTWKEGEEKVRVALYKKACATL